MSAPSESRIAVFGIGGVGEALLELLVERSPSLRLTGVADSRGALAGDLDPRDVLEMKRMGPLPSEVAGSDLVKIGDPDVVVDVMACDPKSGEPALSLIFDAFEHGAHVVTANKMPLARSWPEVM
ncbi:MAG: homoserine dehydrogenase, partial [Actinomycetota bacterium]|nr:homoserine dehydrogenase [Actinomycetota bacterium]